MQHLLFSAILAISLTGCVLSDTKCQGASKGWHKFGDYCYLFELSTDKRMSYYDAEDFCRTEGAHLVSILSKEENDFLRDTVASHIYYYGRKWIGLNSLESETKYQWSDGQPFSYNNFVQKTQYKKESCAIFYGKEGGWRPEHCGLQYTPICKRKDTALEPTALPPFIPDIPEGNCPSGWIQFGHRCYKYFGADEADRLKFKEAQTACTKQGEHHDLVSIHSMQEQAFLTKLMYEFGTSAWIGFRYIENDEIGHDIVFGWTDNSRANFTYWAPGHPPRGTWKYCAYLNNEGFGKGEWMADYCDLTKRGYICERRPDPSVPETTEPPSKCGEDSVGYKDSCYRFYSMRENWYQAESTCLANGGNLVSINDAYELNFLYGFIGSKLESWWTGLINVKDTRIFRWSNGDPLYYSNWGKSQPSIHDLKSSCVSSSGFDALHWSVEKCEFQMPFICETTKGTKPDIPEDVIGDCPSSDAPWIDIGDKYCYQEGEGPTSKSLQWGDNSRNCMSRGLEMVSLSSEHQMRSLFSYLWKSHYNYWLGLIRSFDKESFIWTDGSSLNYTNWAENEPSAWSKNYKYDCVQISMSDLKWYPKDCSDWSGYLCRAKKTLRGAKTPVARSERIYYKTNAVAAQAHKKTDQTAGSSGAVPLLVAGIVCLGLSVFIAAMIFAWKRRNDGHLPTVLPVTASEVSSSETSDTVPKY